MTYNVFSGTLNPTHFTSAENIHRVTALRYAMLVGKKRPQDTTVDRGIVSRDTSSCRG